VSLAEHADVASVLRLHEKVHLIILGNDAGSDSIAGANDEAFDLTNSPRRIDHPNAE
jgi:hypothetical protein